MSLGTISHLQHYFARTGLLDGKGGQMYVGRPKKPSGSPDASFSALEPSGFFLSSPSTVDPDSAYSSMRSSPDVMPLRGRRTVSDSSAGRSAAEGPYGGVFEDEEDPVMLPPTVSTYRDRPKVVPRPPSLDDLRKDLRRSLVDVGKILRGLVADEAEKADAEVPKDGEGQPLPGEASSPRSTRTICDSPDASPTSQGWYELQGLNVLDSMTLAIRAAKMYYTAHEQPARLAAIRSERRLRQDLYGVLDILKRMAMRNFVGGVKPTERTVMLAWIDGVEDLLRQEETMETKEVEEWRSWAWTGGDWIGQEREREWRFLSSFGTKMEQLPSWTSPSDTLELPTPFLKTLQSGLWLVCAHNEMVRKSRKPFGQITTFHTDTLKPYRCADNLRYWVKAAELRWDIILHLDVMGVVQSRSAEVWQQLDAEILRWCTKVRQDIIEDWAEKASTLGDRSDQETEAI